MSPETWTLRSGNDCLVVSPMGATVLDWQVCDLRAGTVLNKWRELKPRKVRKLAPTGRMA